MGKVTRNVGSLVATAIMRRAIQRDPHESACALLGLGGIQRAPLSDRFKRMTKGVEEKFRWYEIQTNQLIPRCGPFAASLQVFANRGCGLMILTGDFCTPEVREKIIGRVAGGIRNVAWDEGKATLC